MVAVCVDRALEDRPATAPEQVLVIDGDRVGGTTALISDGRSYLELLATAGRAQGCNREQRDEERRQRGSVRAIYGIHQYPLGAELGTAAEGSSTEFWACGATHSSGRGPRRRLPSTPAAPSSEPGRRRRSSDRA